MGLTSSWGLILGLFFWLLGERILASSYGAIVTGLVSGSCLVAGLSAELISLRSRDSGWHGRVYRFTAGAMVAISPALYAGFVLAGFDVSLPASAIVWLAPLCCGLPARIAADRAALSGPLDSMRVVARTRSGFAFGLALLGLGLINFAAFKYDTRKDFSYQAPSQPSTQVRELVVSLREPTKLLFLFQRGSEIVPAIRPYADALARVSGRLSVKVEDAALVPDILRKHGARGNGFALLLTGEGKAQRGETFYIGEDLRDARRVLKTLDAHMANHLSALVRPRKVVYLTHGHGERSVAGNVEESRGRWLREFEQLLARFNLRTHRLGLANGLARDVPADAAAVLVMGPERPFLAEEAGALLRYAEGGGRLWLGLEPGVEAGLDSVLRLVGVYPAGPPVVCKESFVVGSRTAADAALVRTDGYVRHPTTKGLVSAAEQVHLVFVRATAVVLTEPARLAQRVAVVQSEDDCFLDAEGDYLQGDDAPARSWPLVVASTFATAGGQEGRVVVSGDGDLPTDQVLRNPANTLVCLDVLRWLVGDDSLRLVAPPIEDQPVLHQRREDRVWFYLTAFGVPGPLFVIAAYQRRRTYGISV